MFCQSCGAKVGDSVSFCHNCGSSMSNKTKTVTRVDSSNAMMNSLTSQTANERKLTLSYLNSVRIAEFGYHKLQEEIDSLTYTINRLGNHKNFKEPSDADNGILNPIIDNFYDEYFSIALSFICMIPAVLIAYTAIWLFLYLGFNNYWDDFWVKFVWVFRISFLASVVLPVINLFFHVKKDRRYHKNDIKEYQENLKNDKLRVEREIVKKRQLITRRNDLKSKLSKAQVIRKNLYSVNMIPQKFREHHAIYFIYEFMATSNISFEQVLLHKDLDNIQKNQQIIIRQNDEITSQLVYMSRQQSEMLKQNDSLYNAIRQTNKKLDRSIRQNEQYQEMAENANEAIRFYSAANFWGNILK